MGRKILTDEEKQAAIERRRERQRRYWHEKHPNARYYKDNDNVERENNHELLNYIQRRLQECGGTMTIIDIAREYYYENKR